MIQMLENSSSEIITVISGVHMRCQSGRCTKTEHISASRRSGREFGPVLQTTGHGSHDSVRFRK